MKTEKLIEIYRRAAFGRLCGIHYRGSDNKANVATLTIDLENDAFGGESHMIDCFNHVTNEFRDRVGFVCVKFKIEYRYAHRMSVCKILIIN